MSAPKKKRHIGRTIGFVLLTILLIGLTTTAICGMVFAVYINKYVSNDVEIYLDSVRMNLTSFLYYVDPETGEEKELDSLHGSENRVWVSLDEIPRQLQLAFISVEDNSFYTHHGINWKRTIGATLKWTGLVSDFTGGGSTITQQVIKNVTGDDDVSVKRKLQEIMRALDLEKRYEKDDILEIYLNKIYFGQGAYGVYQAAKTYFNKEPKDLTLAECASIAGIVKNPYKYDLKRFPEQNAERRETVLYTMKEYGNISQAQYDQAMAEDVQAYRGNQESGDAGSYQSYFEDAVIEAVKADLQTKLGYSESMAIQLLYTGGLKIVTTLDPAIQAKMDAVFLDEENFPGDLGNDGTFPQASMVIMDPYTGYVKALYGGRGEKEGDLVLNRATQTYRSPGSAIKPITVYSPALEYGCVTPITVVDDAPKDFTARGDGIGWPYNENRRYSGRCTILKGIANSYNTVAVDLLQQVGVERSYNWSTTNMGLNLVERMTRTLSDGSTKEYSDKDLSPLSMGSLTKGVTVLEMTAAYCAFVNNGQYTTPVLYTKIYDSNGTLLIDNTPVTTVAMSTKTRDYMIQLLTNVVTNGTGRKAAINGIQVGGKTGTTSADNDRWFAGITPYYAGVVWFGFDRQQSLQKFSTNPALELWHRVMSSVLEGKENASFDLSTPMNKVTYCLDCGLLASDLCSNDVRGSRVATAMLAAEDVPKRTCSCHVSVTLCGSGMIANDYCPDTYKKTVSLMNYQRAYPGPSTVTIGDQQYCAPYELTEEQVAAGYQKAAPATYIVCTTHTQPETPPEPDPPPDPGWLFPPLDSNEPNQPIDPNQPILPLPDTPEEPTDPGTPDDPDLPDTPASDPSLPENPGSNTQDPGSEGSENSGENNNPFSNFFDQIGGIFNP